MKVVWVVGCVAGLVGAGGIVVSIMGSGPCTPPPCQVYNEACQQTCNGPNNFRCRGEPVLTCVNPGPCDNVVCPKAPPCSTAVCIDPAECGDSSAERVVCCRYDFWDAGAPCPTGDEDEEGPSDDWTGTCNEEHECVP